VNEIMSAKVFTALFGVAAGLIAAIPVQALPMPTDGFAGILHVDSVSSSADKVVFLVTGTCSLLLRKPNDPAGGNAQEVVCPLDHAAVVLYRTGSHFTDESWKRECSRLTALIGRKAYFDTATGNYSFTAGDLALVSTDELRVGARP
jgi:hypothetical protein